MAIKQLNKKANENFWDEQWDNQSFERAIAYVKSYKQYRIMKKYTNKEKPVLEGGCGLSQWVYAMHYEGYKIIGVDYAKNTVKRIKEICPELDIREGNVFNLNFPDNFFGTYYSWGVVEHFEDGPEPILKEAYRVLERGGNLLISVPFLNPARKKAYEGLDSIGSGKFYQYLFEEEEFKRKLENVGFKIERIYKLNWIKGYKEIKNFQNKNQSLQTNKVAKTNKNVINKHFSRDNFIKALVKKSVIRFYDFLFLTKYYGHMILFVAKKV